MSGGGCAAAYSYAPMSQARPWGRNNPVISAVNRFVGACPVGKVSMQGDVACKVTSWVDWLALVYFGSDDGPRLCVSYPAGCHCAQV